MNNWPIALLFLLLLLTGSSPLPAQTSSAAILQYPWPASWVTVPAVSGEGYGVFLFRKTFQLPAQPATFVVHVSADNRYKLFVNGQLASLGPARGDVNHWNFETVDLAPYLSAGKNTVAALVWNEGEWRPEAQISWRSGFIAQGATTNEALINTDTSWRCTRDSSYRPLPVRMPTYYVAGPGELVDLKAQPKNWQAPEFSDSHWAAAQAIGRGIPKNILGEYGTLNGWLLVPSSLPPLEHTPQRFGSLRLAKGVEVPAGFPGARSPIQVPPHTLATLVLDQGFLTNAYPTLVLNGGQGATLSLTYVEAPFTQYPAKGNRNDIAGKSFLGRKDSLLTDGSQGQRFTPLSFRTFRYVQVQIRTQNEALELEDVYSNFTGYPFERKAALESGTPEMDSMLRIGWRTARLCAVETYMDCPYYEQLQYIGDARIQGLVSLYNSGDERLLRNALTQMDNSRQPEGVTLSRHPSYTPQYIPTFSLWYLGMLHDYYRYGRDLAFVEEKLPGQRQVLDYFRRFQQADGSLKNVPYWMFTDWVTTPGWSAGAGPVGADGSSAMLDLQLLWAYQLAAELERSLGMAGYADLYSAAAERLKQTIQNKYWDPASAMYADTPEKNLFSQHTNALAILTGMVAGPAAESLAHQLLADKRLAPASIYFKYYLHQALVRAGLGNGYLDWLGKWRENMAMGLSTWAEISEIDVARSDCHAWGASPNIEFFRTVLGIDSAGPAFSRVKIEPHLSKLTQIGGTIPHPKGSLSVRYRLAQGKWSIQIDLPAEISGTLVWKGQSVALHPGMNRLHYRD